MLCRRLRTLMFAAGLAAMAVPAAAQSPTGGPLPPVEDLVRYFDTIVFGSEFGPDYASAVVAKWPGDTLTVSLEQRATEKHLGFVSTHLATLARLTGKKFSGTKTPESAAIRVLFLRRAEMAAIEGPNIDPKAIREAAAAGGCYFMSWKQPESRIVKAIVVVNVERDLALINSCLLEELTQSLGLPNDSDAMRPSIFSDRDNLYELPPHDAILVRTLYDPRMKAGLPRAEALEVARTIISELARPARQPTSRGRGG